MNDEALAPVIRVGQPASPGLALGAIVVWPGAARRCEGQQPGAALSLPDAIGLAVAQLRALADVAAGTDAHKILEFQIEFLGDAALLEPVAAELAAGADPAAAWCTAIGAQIAAFEAATDDYFRHRAADLHDMRSRVLAILAGEATDQAPELAPDAVLLADDLTPSAFLATRWQPGHALVLRAGSATAHVALLARARELPMVVGLGAAALPAGSTVIVDGSTGTVTLGPDARALEQYRQRRAEQALAHARAGRAASAVAATAGGERVQVLLNVASADELAGIDPRICDGIGLVRTEWMFAAGPPGEAGQLDACRRLLRWAGPRPVVVRTLDAGGDKPVPGVTLGGEANPFLGVRGVRLSLSRPGIFKVQLRALLRAAAEGDLRIMIPMVTHAGELREVRALMQACADELRAAGLRHRVPPLGVMVEVPAAALALDRLGSIDFASIGSNDLLQYTMAAARDNAAVASLADPGHPGFERLLALVVEGAAASGVPLSLCGDLAALPAQVPRLLAAGLRSLSVPATAVGAVKRAIAAWPVAAEV